MKQIRTDSWAMQLTPEQQCELYDKTKQNDMRWTQALQWAVSEFGLKKRPSQAAFYRWKAAMRADELARRIEAVASSTGEFRDSLCDRKLIDMFKALAAEAALDGNAKTAATLIHCAATIHDHSIKQSEHDLKEARQQADAVAAETYRPFFQQLAKGAMNMFEATAAGESSDADAAPNADGGSDDGKHDE